MKILQSMTLAATLLLLISAPCASAWAEDGHGDGMHPGGMYVAQGRDHGDRGVERRDRTERSGKVERRDRTERSGKVERRDRGERNGGNVRRSAAPAPRPAGGPVRRTVEGQGVRRSAPASRAPRPVVRDRGVRHDDSYYRQRGFVLDRRYHHDRYYPPRGYFARELPHGYREFHYHGDRYYFYDGIWYRHSGLGFIVIAPPYGMIVPMLPPYYTTIWVGGIPYYYAGGVYYVWRPAMQGYVVTEAPAESKVNTQAPGPDQFYVYPKKGQTPEQQSQDRYECHHWAVGQTNFDPSQPAGNLSNAELVDKRAAYRRAIEACLDARGYSVK